MMVLDMFLQKATFPRFSLDRRLEPEPLNREPYTPKQQTVANASSTLNVKQDSGRQVDQTMPSLNTIRTCLLRKFLGLRLHYTVVPGDWPIGSFQQIQGSPFLRRTVGTNNGGPILIAETVICTRGCFGQVSFAGSTQHCSGEAQFLSFSLDPAVRRNKLMKHDCLKTKLSRFASSFGTNCTKCRQPFNRSDRRDSCHHAYLSLDCCMVLIGL